MFNFESRLVGLLFLTFSGKHGLARAGGIFKTRAWSWEVEVQLTIDLTDNQYSVSGSREFCIQASPSHGQLVLLLSILERNGLFFSQGQILPEVNFHRLSLSILVNFAIKMVFSWTRYTYSWTFITLYNYLSPILSYKRCSCIGNGGCFAHSFSLLYFPPRKQIPFSFFFFQSRNQSSFNLHEFRAGKCVFYRNEAPYSLFSLAFLTWNL